MHTSHPTGPPLLIAVGSLTITQWNQRNVEFWREQSELMRARIKDEVVLAITIRDLESEVRRGVAIRSQKSFEQALADAAESKRVIRGQFAREGGKSRKPDALQQIIERLVKGDPNLSERGLYHALREEMTDCTITQIHGGSDGAREGEICFISDDGKQKSAPLSGLKDRLSRAKKIRANKLERAGLR